MVNSRQLAKIDDQGNQVEVRFHYGVLLGVERERVHHLIRSIADADAVLVDRARRIDFYDSTGKRIGVADPSGGIHLEE